MHNTIAYHSLTEAQTVPEQRCVLGHLPPSLYAEHDVLWCGISLWPVWVSCPGCAPSQLLVHPQPPHWQGSVRS